MDRLAEPSSWSSTALRHHKWGWLWEDLAFCADPLSWPPMDLSGWCHFPTVAESIGTEIAQTANNFGPAMYFPNSVGTNMSNGWVFYDSNPANLMGTVPFFPDWTLALAFDHRGLDSGNKIITHIYSTLFGIHFKLHYNTNTRSVVWTTLAGVLEGPQPDRVDPSYTHRVVITTKRNEETKIYYDGFFVASASWGDVLGWLGAFYIGCDNLIKASQCLQGSVSPILYTRNCWTDEQARLWTEDPWGFLRPDMHPVIAPPFALPPPRFTCAVGDRDLPAETADRDLPAETTDRDLPVETGDRDLPAETGGRDLPAETDGRDLPAETDGRDLPVETGDRDLPVETGDRTVPSPDESGDRETDVEDHEAPRTTDVDEQTC